LTHTSAAIAADSRTNAPPVSVRRNARSGVLSFRIQTVRPEYCWPGCDVVTPRSHASADCGIRALHCTSGSTSGAPCLKCTNSFTGKSLSCCSPGPQISSTWQCSLISSPSASKPALDSFDPLDLHGFREANNAGTGVPTLTGWSSIRKFDYNAFLPICLRSAGKTVG
jgi:hypothetical protein